MALLDDLSKWGIIPKPAVITPEQKAMMQQAQRELEAMIKSPTASEGVKEMAREELAQIKGTKNIGLYIGIAIVLIIIAYLIFKK